jgi:multimeric flavodoxin WrbA
MKIVSILASPRKSGNTGKLIEEVIKGSEENGASIKKYFLQELDTQPCKGCRRCEQGFECQLEDDTKEILKSLQDADAVIFGSPIYFSQVSAQAKLLIDRFYSVFINPNKKFNAKMVLILTHGFPTGTYNKYLDYSAEKTFQLAGFKVVNKMIVGNLHNIGEINKKYEEKLNEAFEIGKNL